MSSDREREAATLAAMLPHFFTLTRPEPEPQPGRIIICDMRSQSFFVLGGEKDDGEPPAIEKMPTVEIKCKEEIEKMCESTGTECVICMEDWGVGDVVKEIPCQHKFHGGCVEKWLKIEDEKKSGGESDNGEIRSEVWGWKLTG